MPVSHARTSATGNDPIEVGLADAAELRILFARLTDPRKRRGVRHDLAAVLTALVFAVLAGAVNFREAGDQVADLPPLLHDAAGTRRDPRTGALAPPSKDTIRRLVEAIDAHAADKVVCTWIAERARRLHDTDTDTGTDSADERYGLALDGKTVRKSDGGRGDVKLFCAMLHEEAIVIAQIRVPEDTNEITQVKPLLDGSDIAGAVVTGDAAHAQRNTAAYICERDADYVLTVKGNQPTLMRAIADRFADARAADHVHDERRAGKRTERAIWTAPAEGIDFPSAAQIFRIRRLTFNSLGEKIGKEIVHGVTSLDVEHATAEAVAAWVRRHWGIENKIHWVRDVVFDEDAQHAYLGSAPQAMACVRNLAIGLLRLAGKDEIKRTLQRIGRDRTRILPLLAASHS